MAAPRKILIRPGVYAPPQGVLHAPASRVRSWAEKFRAMSAAGIKIPVSYGHQPDAWPLDPRSSDPDRARREYHLSAFNAGYLGGMDCGNDGGLAASFACPGLDMDESGNLTCWRRLPDGTEVKTAIGEVSVAIKDWRDGTGKNWEDAIVHVALTPLPVAHGTGGFTLACGREDAPITLSLSSLLYTLSSDTQEATDMADEKESKPEAGTEGGGTDHFKDALAFLSRKGVSLPEDTTPENVWERLCVAGHAIENAGTDAPAELPPEEPDGDEPDPDEGVEYSGEDDPLAGTEEEARPVMMSLATARTKAEKLFIGREQERHRKDLLKRIDALQKRGVSRERLDRLREQANGYTLSMTGDGELVESNVDFLLSSLEDLAPPKHPLKGMKTAQVVKRPGRSEQDNIRAQEDVADELIALAGGTPSKRQQKGY